MKTSADYLAEHLVSKLHADAIKPPMGGINKKRGGGRPPKAVSQKTIGAALDISVRSIQRGKAIARYGAPEFLKLYNAEVKSGREIISMAAAEFLTHFSHKQQDQISKRGAEAVREFYIKNRTLYKFRRAA